MKLILFFPCIFFVASLIAMNESVPADQPSNEELYDRIMVHFMGSNHNALQQYLKPFFKQATKNESYDLYTFLAKNPTFMMVSSSFTDVSDIDFLKSLHTKLNDKMYVSIEEMIKGEKHSQLILTDSLKSLKKKLTIAIACNIATASTFVVLLVSLYIYTNKKESS